MSPAATATSAAAPGNVDFRTLFESAPDLYLVLAPDVPRYTIVAVSNAYARATMTKREELLGRGLFEVFPDNPGDPGATGVSNLAASLARVLGEKVPDTMAVQKYDIRRPAEEGGGFEERWWSPVNSPVLGLSGELAYVIHRVADVTEFVRLKQADIEQRKLTEDLQGRTEKMESEIFERGQEIQEANRQLRQANEEITRLYEKTKQLDRLKDDLASMVVHDLKNPVNGIAMTVQAMLRRTGEVSERQRKGLTTIERTCQEMLRLTQNLLEIAKMEAGRMRVERAMVDLAEVIEQVAREYGPLADEVGKRLVVSVGHDAPRAVGDAGLVKRVLVNLVVNALRHSGAREVRVEVVPVAAERAVTIRVTDNGQGIPPEDMDRIFEKFASVRRNPSGEPSADTGLGLPFCKLAVERMGGTISLTSAPGTETVFAVTLPVSGLR
jgi:signal transduction histidine kinase